MDAREELRVVRPQRTRPTAVALSDAIDGIQPQHGVAVHRHPGFPAGRVVVERANGSGQFGHALRIAARRHLEQRLARRHQRPAIGQQRQPRGIRYFRFASHFPCGGIQPTHAARGRTGQCEKLAFGVHARRGVLAPFYHPLSLHGTGVAMKPSHSAVGMGHEHPLTCCRYVFELTALVKLFAPPKDLVHRSIGLDQHHHALGDGRTDVHTGVVHVHKSRAEMVAHPGASRLRMLAAGRVNADSVDIPRSESLAASQAPFVVTCRHWTATMIQSIPRDLMDSGSQLFRPQQLAHLPTIATLVNGQRHAACFLQGKCDCTRRRRRTARLLRTMHRHDARGGGPNLDLHVINAEGRHLSATTRSRSAQESKSQRRGLGGVFKLNRPTHCALEPAGGVQLRHGLAALARRMLRTHLFRPRLLEFRV